MRRLVILLAAALAGCSVELEGAACDEAGKTDQCPSGQTCGIDKRCSSKPKLECDPPGAEIAVDVEQSGKLGGGLTVTPTGAKEPPGCRLPTLDAALGAVVTSTTGIQIYAGTEETTYPFDAPLQIRDGFMVTSVSSGGEVVLQANTPNVDLVNLAPGGTLRNLTLESTTAGQAGDALTVACGAATKKATILGVKVKGAGKVRRGLTLTGSCGVDATDFVVSDARQEGIFVDTGSTVASTFTRGELARNGKSGLAVWGGKVVVQGGGTGTFQIHDNTEYGVLLTTDSLVPRPVDVTLLLVAVHDNTETGIAVKDAKVAANTASVVIDRAQVYGNKASTALSQFGASNRLAGGILFQGDAPALTFVGNVVCSNAGDEIGVWSTASYTLSAGACSQGSSFINPGTGYFIYSTSGTANVTANNNFWSADPPSSKLVGVSQFNNMFCGVPAVPAYCN